jgi:hypothetical protein
MNKFTIAFYILYIVGSPEQPGNVIQEHIKSLKRKLHGH